MKQATYSEKVQAAMQRLNVKKSVVYNAIGRTAPTLENRFEFNNWRMKEIEILNKLLKIKPWCIVANVKAGNRQAALRNENIKWATNYIDRATLPITGTLPIAFYPHVMKRAGKLLWTSIELPYLFSK